MNNKNLQKKFSGKFIVLDGPDGCGKTVQLELLSTYLKNEGVPVVQTNDPGGTKIGNQISRLLKYDAQGIMNVQTEVMLFMASRAQLVAEIIKPALETGKTVLCDRFISSTCAYQGSSGYSVEKIIELGKLAVGDVWPDLTIIIDIPVEEGLERTGRKPYQKTKVNHKDANQSYLFKNVVVDRFDSRPFEYHRKVRKGFLKLAQYYPGIVKIVDGSQGDIETVHKKILKLISEVSFIHMSLKEIFCQDKAVDILQRAFALGKWAHAYIFAGPEGVGKYKTACEWAKLLLCQNPVIENDFADSCGSCQACQLFEAESHPDFNHIYKELREFTKDGKGKPPPVDLPIDVIREFLIEKVSNKPTLSQRKVFIVSEAEKLNAHSQNALLKVLEEPPEYCSIILLCTRLEKLLPTTKSRSQIIRFGPIAEEQIIEKLQQMDIEEKKARYFGRLAQGSLGAACQWAKLELADANLYETKKELVRALADYEIADALSLAQKLLEKSKKIAGVWTNLDETTSKTDINRRAAKTLVQIIISALYDAMNLNVTPTKETINFDQKEQVKKLAGRFDAEQSAEKISDCYKVLHWIESSVNEKLIFEKLLLNLAESDRMTV